jgi:hypothetical protein
MPMITWMRRIQYPVPAGGPTATETGIPSKVAALPNRDNQASQRSPEG